MKKTKFVLFSNSNDCTLNNEINEWLEKNEALKDFEIQKVTQTESDEFWSISFLYSYTADVAPPAK